jgi:Double-GTPase 2
MSRAAISSLSHVDLAMRCPYCLDAASQFIRDARTNLHHCQSCRSQIPKAYLEADDKLHLTAGVVGFSGHGKTVYLTSLFSVLKHSSKYWAGYYYRSLDDYTHRVIYEQVPRFERGELPESTPVNFPSPALVQYHSLPVFDEAFIGYYDTAGEVFRQVEQIARAGYFVAHSDAVLFIISIPDIASGRADDEMSELLDTYIRAAEDRLAGHIKARQRLIVIFTKSDLLLPVLDERLQKWLCDGVASWYGMDLHAKLIDLSVASLWIEEWLTQHLQASRFVNMARAHFQEVRFTLVSALGSDDIALDDEPKPLRVLDPFLWLLIFAKGTPDSAKRKIPVLDRIVRWFGRAKDKPGTA